MASHKKDDKRKDEKKDRRKSLRFDTSLLISIRFMAEGAPVNGSAVEIGPNGMRVLTNVPLVETSYVLINFQAASNNTHCEGRVVWTQKVEGDQFESGIDVQKWGGGMPGKD